ncbi:MAG: hypothetical protein AAF639_35450, partial [Chloroflexota bacterium]
LSETMICASLFVRQYIVVFAALIMLTTLFGAVASANSGLLKADPSQLEQQSRATRTVQARGGQPAPTATPDAIGVFANVSPQSGTAGTRITVSGGGFPANTRVSLYLAGIVSIRSGTDDPDAYASTTTNSAGNYSMSITMPGTWPDGTPIATGAIAVLVANSDFSLRATDTFSFTAATATPTRTHTPTRTVTPTRTNTPLPTSTRSRRPYAEASPSGGGPNVQVTVFGGGFPANTTVNLYLATFSGQVGRDGGQPKVYATTRTDSIGNYSMTFVTPETWPDGRPLPSSRVLLLVATSGFGTEASAIYNYAAPPPTPTRTPTRTPRPATATPTPTLAPIANPYALVRPNEGTAGTQVIVWGGGFPGNTNVNLYLAGIINRTRDGRPATVYATARTNPQGFYRFDLAIPSTWPDGVAIAPGRLAFLIATRDFEVSATTSFEYLGQRAAPPPTNTPRPTSTPTRTPVRTATWTPAPQAQSPQSQSPQSQSPQSQSPQSQSGSSGVFSPATISILPDEGGAGTPVHVWGDTFPANTNVTLYLGKFDGQVGFGELMVYATLRTDSFGRYSMSFDMPANWPDGTPITDDRILILVATDDFSTEAGTSFDYEPTGPTPTPDVFDGPTLQINPRSGTQGTVIALNGGGFPANTTLGIYLAGLVSNRDGRSDPDSLATIRTDARGNFSGNFTMPGTWPDGSPILTGRLAIMIATSDFADRATATFSYTAPQATSLFNDNPSNNVRGQNAYFCSGFVSECNFANCPRNYRMVYGPYCRNSDYPYIIPGEYKVSVSGTGRVRIGATDFGQTSQLFGFGSYDVTLPASYTFCWRGRQPGGYGFETIVQSMGGASSVSRISIEYLGTCQ